MYDRVLSGTRACAPFGVRGSPPDTTKTNKAGREESEIRDRRKRERESERERERARGNEESERAEREGARKL